MGEELPDDSGDKQAPAKNLANSSSSFPLLVLLLCLRRAGPRYELLHFVGHWPLCRSTQQQGPLVLIVVHFQWKNPHISITEKMTGLGHKSL